MLRKISAMKVRQVLGQIMNEVDLRNDEYIIERNGKPLAALVPVWMVLNKKRRTEEIMKIMEKSGQTEIGMTDEEIQAEITRAIRDVREKKAKRVNC